jgi:hypothetical protein
MYPADRIQDLPGERLRTSTREVPLSLSELVKFTALAASLAMFADAAVAHAMLWGNDPYWTYWVTDALLMATVFGLGTAWLGVGLTRGAALTAVHVLLLTTYYWTLSPIGLPGQPEWLDLERTWVTGLPVHFVVYYLGYVLALWLRTRSRRRHAEAEDPAGSLGRTASIAVALAAAIVIALGLVQTVLGGQFPGATWFIVRIAVVSPFVLAWWTMAGADRAAAVSGGVMLGFLLVTYGHYLAPVGLPNPSLRLIAEDPPPALVEWLSYRQEFLVLLPAALALAVGAMLLASRWRHDGLARTPARARLLPAPLVAVAVLALVGLGAVTAAYTGPEANRTTVSAVGDGSVERGAPFGGDMVPTGAMLTMTAENRNTHRTPLPPHDEVDIKATITGADGKVYVIDATQPMVADARGRHTTWAGVGFDVWHHGRSGIGNPAIPPVHSDVAVYALGEVSAGGESVAVGVPVHVMTSSRPDARLELHVGDAASPVGGLQDGHLRVVWAEYSGGHVKWVAYARYALGSGALLVLLGFALALVRRDMPDTTT